MLNESVKPLVRFQEANLVRDDSELWWPGSYDVIFCRNVLMYFSHECAISVVRLM